MHPFTSLAVFLASPSPVASPAVAATTADNVLPILDGAIVLIVVVALFIGYQKGIIQPLMTYLFTFGALFLIYRDHVRYLATLQKYLHLNIVLAIFLALVIAVVAGYGGSVVGQALHRMPIARGVDGFLGIFLNVAIAIGVIYFAISGLITFDKAFAPIVDNAKLTSAQVTTLSNQLQSNPLAAALVDPKDLASLKAQAANGKQASLSTVSQLENLRNFYNDFLKPQLRTSRLAPYVMRFGQRIPILGHLGPNDLPKK